MRPPRGAGAGPEQEWGADGKGPRLCERNRRQHLFPDGQFRWSAGCFSHAHLIDAEFPFRPRVQAGPRRSFRGAGGGDGSSRVGTFYWESKR